MCRKCKGPTTVYRTYGKKVVTRERRCEKCIEQWETLEREAGGTRARYGDAISSTPAAQGHQVAAPSSSDLNSLPTRSNPDQTPARVSEPIAPPDKEVFSFPIVGGIRWSYGDRLHAENQAAFPHLDLSAEYAKARAWLVANPSKQKTPRGMPKFIFAWLERAQNAGRATAKTSDARCAYHRAQGTRGKLPRFGAVGDCPECKHALAASRSRASDPTPVVAIVPATRDEIDRARKEASGG